MSFFSKTHQSSLTLKGGSTSHLGLLPSGKKRKPPYSVLKPLRYKVGGPSEVFASSRAAVCGMRPHGYKSLTGCLVLALSLLVACSKLFRKPTWISLTLMRDFSKTHQSSLTLKGGSTSHLGLLPSGKKRKPLLLVARNHFILWLADHQRSTPAAELRFAVCDRMDTNRLRAAWCLLEVCLVLARSLLGACLKLFRKPIWISLVLMTEV